LNNSYRPLNPANQTMESASADRRGQQILIEICNGCVCCTVCADLVTSVKELLAGTRQAADKRLDRLIIETPRPTFASAVRLGEALLADVVRGTSYTDHSPFSFMQIRPLPPRRPASSIRCPS
jgi:hypothetical protein